MIVFLILELLQANKLPTAKVTEKLRSYNLALRPPRIKPLNNMLGQLALNNKTSIFKTDNLFER